MAESTRTRDDGVAQGDVLTRPAVSPITSRIVPLPIDHIDTDQIIPARFLKVISKNGLADALFADWREDESFVLNQPESRGAEVLLAGGNFGCGSSREHAPWALIAGGFRAVIATSFADIFRGNALNNRLIPVALDADAHAWLLARRAQDPGLTVTIDLESLRVTAGGGELDAGFEVEPFARHCILEGLDKLGYLLTFQEQIGEYESSRP